MKPSTEILLVVALGVSIAVGAVYVASHVDLFCLFGKCAAVVH